MTPSVENPSPARAVAAVPRPPAEPEVCVEPPDAEAWAEVLAGWEDEARHRAYLDRFGNLDGLAMAGGRYRAVLAARPGDPIAARFRDEVVGRAMAQGLAALPRSAAEHGRAKLVVRIAAGAVIGGLVLAAIVMATRMAPYLSGGAHP